MVDVIDGFSGVLKVQPYGEDREVVRHFYQCSTPPQSPEQSRQAHTTTQEPMMNMIYSSLDKITPHSPNAEIITLTPTLASQRLLAALINDMLDTCEIDCTPTVQDFADKFIGEPVGLAEGSLIMQLYDNIHCNVARKLAQRVNAGDYALHPEIQAGYRLAYQMHKVMTEQPLGFGLKPFREQMRESMMTAFDKLEAETAE